jgi:rhamnose transport system permease protein
VLAIAAPGYFSAENLSDVFLANLPVLLIAVGMTLVIVTGEIDISVGSTFAVCGVAAGILAKAGVPPFSPAPPRACSARPPDR